MTPRHRMRLCAGEDAARPILEEEGPLRTGQNTDHTSWMLTSLLLWLCSLPLVGLIVLPWLGPRVAATVAVALLALAVTACYAICTWPGIRLKQGRGDE